MDDANLFNYGVAGICLAALGWFASRVFWSLLQSLKDKDKELEKVNNQRADTATAAVEAITKLREQLGTCVENQEKILALLINQQPGRRR